MFQHVTLIVDSCDDALVIENENAQTSFEERHACEGTAETLGDNKYINVNAPLQLGGRSNHDSAFPLDVMKEGFKGCIRNFMHNGEVSS